jgi:hypothetical protein
VAGGAIFISYRRQDAPGYAGRLYDALAARFGDERVFMDIGGIEPGADFAQQIDEAVGSCDVLLAVIGPEWATVTDARGRRRLDDPDDFVALEISTALPRPEVKVIPVLVDGARMPMQTELPPALAALGRRQAIELSAARWRYDVETLLGTLERALGGAGLAAGQQPPITEPERTVARGQALPVPLADALTVERARISEPATHNAPAQPAKARHFARWAIAAAVVVAVGLAAVLALGGGSGGGGSSDSQKLPPGGTSIPVDNAKPPMRGDKVVAAAQTNVKGNAYRLVLSTRDAKGAKRARVPLDMNLYVGQPFKLLQRREMPFPWYRDSVVASLKVEANPEPNSDKSAGVAFSWYPHVGDQTDVTHYFGVANHGIDIY